MEKRMALAAKLKELRLKTGKSLQALADEVGASKAHIWDLETGRATNPTIELLTKISTALNTSISDLVGENPGAETQPEVVAMYRDFNHLTPTDRETIKMMMERLKKRPE
jgi:transcriptional regulator with XRE-family HTH domain